MVIEDLFCAYGKTSVLRGVDLRVDPGEAVGLVGRNGAGKTTTLRAISGVVPRRSGRITFGGKPLPDRPRHVAGAGIAHVPEGRGLIGALTAEENLRVAGYGAGHPVDEDTLRDVVDVFPRLQGILDRRADVLSGGEQQMVALARALVAKASLVLIDELSLGLAPIVVDGAWQALLQLRERDGLSLLVVDQNLGLIQKYCDTVYLLRDGVTRTFDSPEGSAIDSVY
ncbi:ABC transporter ATP-binding protein [Streptomyces sp. NPDC058424]|uniref:ABC transporter ATP-binding protein n=1 Tax=Streptomyces sp. NPDC058424 TaxID=3346491 RepID=UPI003650F529